MKTEKQIALEHFDRRMTEFRDILFKVTFTNRHYSAYHLTYERACRLVTKYFGKQKEQEFIEYVNENGYPNSPDIDYTTDYRLHRERINRCIRMAFFFSSESTS